MDDIYEGSKAQVFISYSKDDRELCTRFIEQLSDDATKVAAAVWYDSALTPARKWEEEIFEKLRNADIIFALVSPTFLKSEYCMRCEMPIIRRQEETGKAAVRVVRLRECDIGGSDFADLTVWPKGMLTVDKISDASREMKNLRAWFKVEICKALVARNTDRDHSFAPTLDDLHEEFGESAASGRRYATWVGSACALGAASGVATKALLFPLASSPRGAILFFAAIGFFATLLKGVFQFIEVMDEEWRSTLREFGPLVLIAALASAVIAGTLLGLPLCIVLWIGGWKFNLGFVGAAIAGALLSAWAGYNFVLEFSPKRLKVFTDVEHLYRAPKVKPLPSSSFSAFRMSSRETAAGLSEEEAEGAEPPDGDGDTEVPSLLAAETSAEDGLEQDPDVLFFRAPESAEQVPLSLVVVGAAARPEATNALMSALEQDGAADVFRMVLVTDEIPDARELSFWQRTLERHGYCLVIMTSDLVQSGLPGIIQQALSRYFASFPPKVYPVLVENRLPSSTPLMDRQGLPTGQMPIEKWPIRDNAWVNVSRKLLQEAGSPFLYRLTRYLEKVVGKEIALRGREAFIDPRHDFSHYPFRNRVFHWSQTRAFVWGLAGVICYGMIGGAIASSREPGASLLGSIVFLLVLACLGLRDTLDYANARLQLGKMGGERISVFSLLLDSGFDRLKRGPVLQRTARVLALPFGLVLSGIAALLLLWPHPDGGSIFTRSIAGAAIGFLCYAGSRYRIPAVTIRREIPTPSSMLYTRQGLSWTLQSSNNVRSSLSAWMVLRAFLDTVWLTALGGAALVGSAKAGAPPGIALFLSLCLVSFLVQCMFRRPKPLFLAHEPKWRPWWRMMWQDIFWPISSSVALYSIPVILGGVLSPLSRGNDGLEHLPAAMTFGGILLVTFSKRLLHQIILSARLG